MMELIIVWAILIVVAIIVELSTVTLTSIWFALGAVVALLLAIFNVGPLWQVLSFIAISALLLLATRPLAKKLNEKDVIKTNSDKIISMIGVVTKEIAVGEIGEVKVNLELWRAISADSTPIKVGEQVIINSLNGNKVLVSRVTKENETKYV